MVRVQGRKAEERADPADVYEAAAECQRLWPVIEVRALSNEIVQASVGLPGQGEPRNEVRMKT